MSEPMTRADAIWWVRGMTDKIIGEFCAGAAEADEERADCERVLRTLGCTDEELAQP